MNPDKRVTAAERAWLGQFFAVFLGVALAMGVVHTIEYYIIRYRVQSAQTQAHRVLQDSAFAEAVEALEQFSQPSEPILESPKPAKLRRRTPAVDDPLPPPFDKPDKRSRRTKPQPPGF